jgi:hypothetical protein
VFRATGRRGLWQAMAKRGGPERFAEEYGLPYSRNDRAIGEAETRERRRAALRGSDLPCWPPRRWLIERGGWEPVAAIDRSGGAERWAEALGVPLRQLRGQRWTPELMAAAVEPLLEGRSAWPSRLQFERAGLGGLWFAIHHGEGHVPMAARCGLALRRPDLQGRRRHAAKGRRTFGGRSASRAGPRRRSRDRSWRLRLRARRR